MQEHAGWPKFGQKPNQMGLGKGAGRSALGIPITGLLVVHLQQLLLHP
jgi:hypothetical protein